MNWIQFLILSIGGKLPDSQVGVDSFVTKLLAASLDDKRIISETLTRRYEFQEFNKFLVDELPWLKQVAEKPRAEIDARVGKISSLTIQACLTAIEKAILALEPYSNGLA